MVRLHQLCDYSTEGYITARGSRTCAQQVSRQPPMMQTAASDGPSLTNCGKAQPGELSQKGFWWPTQRLRQGIVHAEDGTWLGTGQANINLGGAGINLSTLLLDWGRPSYSLGHRFYEKSDGWSNEEWYISVRCMTTRTGLWYLSVWFDSWCNESRQPQIIREYGFGWRLKHRRHDRQKQESSVAWGCAAWRWFTWKKGMDSSKSSDCHPRRWHWLLTDSTWWTATAENLPDLPGQVKATYHQTQTVLWSLTGSGVRSVAPNTVHRFSDSCVHRLELRGSPRASSWYEAKLASSRMP